MSLARFACLHIQAAKCVSVRVTNSEVPRCQMQASEGSEKLGAGQQHSSQAMWIHSSCSELDVRKRESRLLSVYIHGQFFQSRRSTRLTDFGFDGVVPNACGLGQGIGYNRHHGPYPSPIVCTWHARQRTPLECFTTSEPRSLFHLRLMRAMYRL